MRRPNFRSPTANARLAQTMYHGLYDGSPNAYLLLTPELRIIEANNAYLSATRARREQLAGQYMFDAFPDNPDDRTATGVRNLMASFQRSLSLRAQDRMPVQRYDLRNPEGAWEERHWLPVNWPIMDESKTIVGLVHHVRVVPRPSDAAKRLSQLLGESRSILATTVELRGTLQELAVKAESAAMKLARHRKR